MLGAIARRLFGTANERFLKGLNRDIAAINALEPQLEVLSDDELRARTPGCASVWTMAQRSMSCWWTPSPPSGRRQNERSASATSMFSYWAASSYIAA